MMWVGFIWLRTGTSSGLMNMAMNLQVPLKGAEFFD
jgi:hypothetical protein